MTRLDAQKFLEDLTGRHARNYTAIVQDMVVAMATGNKPALRDARERMEAVTTETMGTAEILGASISLQAAAKIATPADVARESGPLLAFAASTTQTILPRVTFEEAVQDMIDRTPATIRNAAERTAQRISQLYGEGRVVAFARSAEHAVTERVQGLITQAIREGTEEIGVGRLIKTSVDEIRTATAAWSEGYARMAFRTNVNTAVTAGRFRQAQDPDIKAVMPAMEFFTVGDSDTRSNHQAGDGIIMLVDNQAWRTHAPPLAWNCRCGVRQVGLPELRRMGRVNSDGSIREDKPPAAWKPDPGFRHGGRPDLLLTALST